MARTRAWSTASGSARYDANDAVDDSRYRLERQGLPSSDPEKQALTKARAHADTPNRHGARFGRTEAALIELEPGGGEPRHPHGS